MLEKRDIVAIELFAKKFELGMSDDQIQNLKLECYRVAGVFCQSPSSSYEKSFMMKQAYFAKQNT